jgi:hypothetical protein
MAIATGVVHPATGKVFLELEENDLFPKSLKDFKTGVLLRPL